MRTVPIRMLNKPDNPRDKGSRFRPVRSKTSINLQENLLGQVFSLVKPSGEPVSQVVNPLMVLANYGFPGRVAASQAAFHQFRIGYLQPSLAPLPRY